MDPYESGAMSPETRHALAIQGRFLEEQIHRLEQAQREWGMGLKEKLWIILGPIAVTIAVTALGYMFQVNTGTVAQNAQLIQASQVHRAQLDERLKFQDQRLSELRAELGTLRMQVEQLQRQAEQRRRGP